MVGAAPSFVAFVVLLFGQCGTAMQFKTHAFCQGNVAVIPPDMFPAILSNSADFNVSFCLMDRDFTYHSFYDVPNSFFDNIYIHPIIQAWDGIDDWFDMLEKVYNEVKSKLSEDKFTDLVHFFALEYYDKWIKLFGDKPIEDNRSQSEIICARFYNLVFDHFRNNRSTAFYADKLCISPCYLATVTRQVCDETPKQAIDRQVTMELKYVLRYTSMTTKQIASYLNFPDTSYMCRYFRRQTGLSLSEYRKSKR